MKLGFFASVVCFGCLTGSAALAQERNLFENLFGERTQTASTPPEVTDARSKADSAYQKGDYAKVIELATWLMSNYPEDNPHVAYHLRASAKIEQGRQAGSAKLVREGITDSRQAILSAGREYPWVYIPYAYGLSSLAEIERRKDHAELAVKILTPVLQYPETKNFTGEDRANLYYQRGLAYAATGDFKQAERDHSEAIRLSPQHLGSLLKRAEVLNYLGQTAESLKAYDLAVERSPNSLVAFNDRGKLRRSTGDLDGAMSDFDNCLRIDPKFAVGYINRGMCLLESNNPHAAEGDFTQALAGKLDPATSALTYRQRATARLALGQAPEAIADLNAAIKLSPKEAALFEERGYAQFYRHEFASAARDFQSASELNPQLGHLIPWRALALARGGMTAEARAFLEAALNSKTPPMGWPVKLCELFLDRTTPVELAEIANSATAERDKRQLLCEAKYFAGQKQLLEGGDANEAAELFRAALATQAFSLAAYRGAGFETQTFSK
ncbi:MAG: tetratricopeptide repeat protein [Planctomycetes bacterium]|nr:tetratricopeptide repeat protein [Planctomycetota bacterium]